MKTERGLYIIFALTLMALFALASWWIVFLKNAIELECQTSLQSLDIRAMLEASRLGDIKEPPMPGPIPGKSDLEIVFQKDGFSRSAAENFVCKPLNLYSGFSIAPLHPGAYVRLSDTAIEKLRKKLSRRRLMVYGESSLLIVLLGVCTFMLYRMLRLSGRHYLKMEQFIASVTHEMKTPLTGLKSMLQTFIAGRVPADKSQLLYAMGLKETERLEHTVENILVAGRIRTGGYDLKIIPTDIRSLVERFHAHRLHYLTGSVSSLQLVMRKNEPVSALCDSRAVEIILENLTDNAFKYGGPSPEIRIEAKAVDNQVEISVTDKGLGFSNADLDSIFTPFDRLDDANKTSTHGTGLGLSISLELAQKMNGSLKAMSPGPGKGSTFTLILEKS